MHCAHWANVNNIWSFYSKDHVCCFPSWNLELMCEGQTVSDICQGIFTSENTLTVIDLPWDPLQCYNTLVRKLFQFECNLSLSLSAMIGLMKTLGYRVGLVKWKELRELIYLYSQQAFCLAQKGLITWVSGFVVSSWILSNCCRTQQWNCTINICKHWLLMYIIINEYFCEKHD